MKSILDKDFRYTPSASTNLKATFARVRKEQRESERKATEAHHARVLSVRHIGSAR